MQHPGYTVSPWNRPPYQADGVIVCRRAFASAVGGQHAVGEVVPLACFQDERALRICWEQRLVDTMPGAPVEPVVQKPSAPKAAPPRGR